MDYNAFQALKDELLEGVLQEDSLSFVALKLAQVLEKSIYICDFLGRVLVGQISEDKYALIHSNIELPMTSCQKYYEVETQRLFFAIGKEQIVAYIVVKQVQEEEIEQILPILAAADLSLCFYFSKLNAIKDIENKYKDSFILDLLFNNIVDNEEILVKGKLWGWDFHKEYFVAIIEPDSFTNIRMFGEELEYLTQKSAKKYSTEMITSIRNGTFIVLCQKNNKLGVSIQKDIVQDLYKANKYISSKYEITFSIGIGHSYLAYKEIYKSYQEAKTALAIARLLGEEKFIKYFNELGVFKLLYKQEAYLLKEFYLETLEQIIAFDQANNGELLTTLETLISNNMDLKTTAEILFIHVNTLRYRIKKVEEILKIDTNKLENIVNLFIALKIRALLKMRYNDIY
ncbi:MAG: hypothetical protein VR72_12250 [Clostridiaceae bacterium BRH_c20a]|nr:MAG: hypothetical protein VR72_12250 [Clostridiaceae bacterium BRH_c20a]